MKLLLLWVVAIVAGYIWIRDNNKGFEQNLAVNFISFFVMASFGVIAITFTIYAIVSY